jgi:N-acetylglucosaminyl-diphospho-decaprenol L-rhamnosyltransferase
VIELSVLIVNYKVYDELTACLTALTADPDGRNAEVVIVDYESDQVRLTKALTLHPQASAISHRDNRGFAAGINEAAARASGRLLLLLNPDARVEAGTIRTLTTQLESAPNILAVGPCVVSLDGEVQPTGRTFPTALTGLFGRTSMFTRFWPQNPVSRRNLPSADAREPIDVDWIAGTCVLIRAETFRAVDGFDEGYFLYWEDADLCQRLRERGGRIMYVPHARVLHGTAKSSQRAPARSLVQFHLSALRYYGKHQRGPSRVVALPFAAAALTARLAVKLLGLAVRR